MFGKPYSMDIGELRNSILSALYSVVATTLFEDMVQRNWCNNQGNEEEIYPYFTEALRRLLGGFIKGIGPGKIRNRGEKVDCLVELPSGIYAVELKGPSKDHAFIAKGMSEDFCKLSTLKSASCIHYGIAIGIFIEKTTLPSEYQRVLMLDNTSVGVKVEIKETEQATEPDGGSAGAPLPPVS
jgi:hypothetical protein